MQRRVGYIFGVTGGHGSPVAVPCQTKLGGVVGILFVASLRQDVARVRVAEDIPVFATAMRAGQNSGILWFGLADLFRQAKTIVFLAGGSRVDGSFVDLVGAYVCACVCERDDDDVGENDGNTSAWHDLARVYRLYPSETCPALARLDPHGHPSPLPFQCLTWRPNHIPESVNGAPTKVLSSEAVAVGRILQQKSRWCLGGRFGATHSCR